MKKYEMTIAPELLEAWQKARRKGDPEKLASLLGRSRPVIDRALKYGCVKDSDIIDGITKFYVERLNKEGADGKELLKKIG